MSKSFNSVVRDHIVLTDALWGKKTNFYVSIKFGGGMGDLALKWNTMRGGQLNNYSIKTFQLYITI